jgi:outer membrane lipoprotein carrier protein
MTAMTLLLLTSLAAPPAPADVLARVQAAYRKLGDMQARFSQIYVDKLRGKKREEVGQLWAKQDGRLRWSYEKPTAKDFVYDGKTAYFYEPENAQVTVFERFQDSPLSGAVRFLWGQGNISELFDVKPCATTCDVGEKGDWVVELWPKAEIPTVDHSVFAVDPKSDKVRVSIVFDPLGNRSEYRLTELKAAGKVPDAKFQFDVPKGVSVIRAATEGQAPPEDEKRPPKPEEKKPAPKGGDKKPEPK